MKKLLFPAALLFLATACITGSIDECYRGVSGRARITEVKTSRYNPDGKGKYLDIFFDFYPDGKNAPEQYRYKKFKDVHQRLFHKHRGNLYRPWVEKMNIKTGNIYRAMRYEKNCYSSSAPVIFRVLIEKESIK